MKLYHGTSTDNLKGIIKDKAIRPRTCNGNWKHTLTSNNQMVYLTNCYGVSFGFSAAKQLASEDVNWNAEDYDESLACVIELDISVKNLYPDEDAIEQLTRKQSHWVKMFDDLGIDDMVGRTNYFKKNIADYKDLWKDSIDGLGTVAHKGSIPISKIKRVSILKDEVFLLSQPTITIENYRFLGERYKHECETLIWTKDYAKQIIKGRNLK